MKGRVVKQENKPAAVYTCRTTDFTCQTSPAMHRAVVGFVERGLTAEQVLDEFVAQHGELVLMAPPKRGFNIVGYVLPSMAITLVGATMLWMLARRASRKQMSTVTGGAGAAVSTGLSAEDEVRLKAELADLDS